MKINKKIKTLFCFLLLFAHLNFAEKFVLAETKRPLEVVYPTLIEEVAPPQSARTYLPRYFQYLYTFGIFIAGLIALAALLWGGFRYITSAGNPGTMSDARDQIFSGILGLVIILGTYIFLNELNPQLTQFRLPAIEPVRRGIILYNKENCAGLGEQGGLPEFHPDLDPDIFYQAIESTFPNLKDPKNPGGGFNAASFYTFHSGNQLSVYFYANENCEGDSVEVGNLSNMEINTCVNLRPIAENAKCIRLIWRLPGVWLFGYPWGNPLEPGRDFSKETSGERISSNLPFAHFQLTQESLPRELNDKVHSIGLVNETEKEDVSYGVILHNLDGGFNKNKGWAHIFLPDNTGDRDVTVYNFPAGEAQRVSSVTVFTIPEKESAGDEEFVICRNPRCDEEWDNNRSIYVYPQRKIAWVKRSGEEIELTDLSDFPCRDSTGRSINSRSQNAIANPNRWDKVSCDHTRIIGGAMPVDEPKLPWLDEDERNISHVGKINNIIRGRTAGISAIYLPSSPQYIVLLYDNTAPGASLIQSSATDPRSSAAVIIGNVADLTTLRWNDRTTTIVVVRIGSFY